jgi:putative protease
VKYLTFAQSLHDLNLIKEEGINEVILGHRDFSRFGKLDNESFFTLANRARELNLKVTFEWDILMTENVFQETSQKLKQFINHFDSLRVQDPGALEWSLTHTDKPLQFIAENGNHNLLGLKGWEEYAGPRLERIVLSIELSKSMIEEYVKELTVPCELLGFGRILLFYSPRNLLSPLTSQKIAQNSELAALGESEESPHKGFPIVENKHGTFMFHIKEFCLLEYREDLMNTGLDTFRIDLRWEGLSHLSHLNNLKESYPKDLMRGFYLVNKTDVLFPKLKNSRLQKREGNYLGEILEAEKGCHLAILVKNIKGIHKSEKLKIIHPKGEVFEVQIHWLKNIDLEEVESVPLHKIALIPYINGVWVKSHVFLQDS